MQTRMRTALDVKSIANDRGEWMRQTGAQIFGALVEAKHIGLALFLQEQVEHPIDRLASALIGNFFKGLADRSQVRFAPYGGDMNVGPPPRNRALDFVADELPLLRIA